MFLKKDIKKITTNVEIFDVDFFINELNKFNIYLNYKSEELAVLHSLIEEHREQVEYKNKTGKNFFMVIIKMDTVVVYKNGFYLCDMLLSDVVVKRDETIDIKYIRECEEGDYVEFYLD